MNNVPRQDVSEEPLDRLRRLIETGRWQPNCFCSGVISGRFRRQTSKSVFKIKKSRTRFRYVCLFTGVVAFVLGFVVGTMLPFLLVTNGDLNKNATFAAEWTHEPSSNMTEFDRVSFVKETPTAKTSDSAHSKLSKSKGTGANAGTGDSVVSGTYWGDVVEAALPAGFTEADMAEWRAYTRNATVGQVKEGCGRMQNRLVKFSDGTASCCRYRRNTDQIQGELFSFYLGQTLGLRNTVPTTLGLVKMRDTKWSSVRSEMILAQWVEDKPVVFTKFIPNLITAFIPFNFRNANRRLYPTDITSNLTRNSSQISDVMPELVELAQWSDMIIFDYLTANLDRVVNNLYNLQWNFAMMDAPTHNLRRTMEDKLLVFLDNESGLLHGYRLLEKYEVYHATLLDSLCVFRKSTADIIKRLKKDGNIGEILQNAFNKYEPDFQDYLPGLPDKSISILNDRIARVFDVIEKCESMFPEGRTR